MKKILYLLAASVLIFSALALSSCGCEHEVKKIDGTPATCTEDGISEGEECTLCGKILKAQEVIASSGHNYNENCVCTVCEDVSHSYEHCICTACGLENPDEALEYTLSGNGKYYIVSGMGNHKGNTIIIPETHNGKPVSAIGNEAFKNKGFTRIVIPSSIKTIGMRAFYGSTVSVVELSEGLELINYRAFYQCVNLKKIVLPNSLVTLEPEAFYGCGALKEVVIGNSLENIKNKTFQACSLEKVVIGNKVNRFGTSDVFDSFYIQFHIDSVEHWNAIENSSLYISSGESFVYVNGALVNP